MKQKHIALLLAVLGASMVLAGGAMAASSTSPDYENATQVTDGDNMTQFNGSDEAYYLNRTWASDNPEIRVIDPETNQTVETWSKSDLSETVNDSTNNTWAYRLNFTESHLDEVEMDSGENKSITFRMVANASVSEENQTYTNWTVYAENVEGRTTYRLGPAATSSDALTLDSDGFTIETLGWSFFEDDYAEYEQSNVPINGTGSDVTLHYANSTSVDALDQSVSDYNNGDWVKRTIVEVETTDGESLRLPAYKNSIPDDVDAQNDSYAVIDNQQNTVRANLGDEVEGETKVNAVSVRANADSFDYIQFYQTKLFGLDSLNFTFDFGGLLSITGGMTFLGSSPVLFGRPEDPFAS